jgi:hypothetical protein
MSIPALLSTLIPGDGGFPAAGALDLPLDGHPRFGAPLAAVLAALPEGFAGLASEAREHALAAVEAADPAAFSALQVGLYSLYYTHPEVTAVIARETGYAARPPQPEGHALAPFTPDLVAVPAARAPHFRRPPGFDPSRLPPKEAADAD